MRIALVAVLLFSSFAHADRGPWHTRASATAALWARFAVKEPARVGVLTTRGALVVDVPATALCKMQQKGVVKKKAPWLECFGQVLAQRTLNPQWIVMTADKLSSKEHQQFAKRFGKTTRFAVNTHRGGNVVLALAPTGHGKASHVVGVLLDEIKGMDI